MKINPINLWVKYVEYIWGVPKCAHAQSCLTFVNPWTVACQAPQCMKFSRQEYWRGLPFPTPGDLPDPGTKFMSPVAPALAERFFTNSITWETQIWEIYKPMKKRNTIGIEIKSSSSIFLKVIIISTWERPRRCWRQNKGRESYVWF